ncbi:MAG: ATP-binding protein, partial [Zetaproteobacteria bacterium]
MLAHLVSATIAGLDAVRVDVEVDLAPGLPSWAIVGLPEASVREAKERVRAAITNSGLQFPLRRITVNLAPADMRKEGSHFDLPMALGILAGSGQISGEAIGCYFFAGELALDGTLRPFRGALALALFAKAAGMEAVVMPPENAAEAAAVGVCAYAAKHLVEVVRFVRGEEGLARAEPAPPPAQEDLPDLADVHGQMQARRALEIAAAGGHHLLMIGPPGVGKSMLAARLPGILPPLDEAARMEVARLYSVAGEPRSPLAADPPFRAPHHTASD